MTQFNFHLIYQIFLHGFHVFREHGFLHGINSTKRFIDKKTIKTEYRRWIIRNEPDKTDLEKQKSFLFYYQPRISIICPLFRTDIRHFKQLIYSVEAQTYANWELCLATSEISDELKIYIEETRNRNPRIYCTNLTHNKGIAGNSNAAIGLAKGEFYAFLDHDDTLSPDALYEIVSVLQDKPHAILIYSDEDLISNRGRRKEPHFKPGWSPDTFLSYNYLCHLTIIKMTAFECVNGFREEFEGSQDYDLFLRVIANCRVEDIIHIPKILYHWRASKGSTARKDDAKPYAFTTAKKALEEHLKNLNRTGCVTNGIYPSTYRVHYTIPGTPDVAIIIPTKNNPNYLERCIVSIVEKTIWKNYSVYVLDNGTQGKTLEILGEFAGRKVKILSYPFQFSFSSINNFGAGKTQESLLVFLNDDTEIVHGEWLEEMLSFAIMEDIGAVGAQLIYPDKTIQHAGVILGIIPPDIDVGVAGHSHKGMPISLHGYFNRPHIIGNYSAVTAACMMVERRKFLEAGGFSEDLEIALNDVDLCLKLGKIGYRTIYTPYARLIHFESISRGYEDTPYKVERYRREISIFRERWNDILIKGDPYYSPNLTLNSVDYSIRE